MASRQIGKTTSGDTGIKVKRKSKVRKFLIKIFEKLLNTVNGR